MDVVLISVFVNDFEWSNGSVSVSSNLVWLGDTLPWFQEGGSGVGDWVSWDTFVLWVGWVSSVWISSGSGGLGLVIEFNCVGSGGESEEGEEFHFLYVN